MEQHHLNYKDTVNFGSYYTPQILVDMVYGMLAKNIENISDYTIIDTSCGYGGFLRGENTIGADIDEMALITAKKNNPSASFYCHNSLKNISLTQYNLNNENKIIIVGNPPYNDATSLIKNHIKQEAAEIDKDIKSQDLGISFLQSYNKLGADFVCVLHPLSYLIKKANFERMGRFTKNYKLIDALIISSGEFSKTSKTTQFPIVIAMYHRDNWGMKYYDICDWNFKTKEGKQFKLANFDKIDNYITKYPNKKYISLDNTVAYFWTMRDINALKRTKTFIEKENTSSIRVTKDKFAHYCYADIFKENIKHIPYYFGNCDIFINNDKFNDLRDLFIEKSTSKYKFLNKYNFLELASKNEGNIDNYFRNLLGEHYVD
ncbi:MAG: SAM-dependent methyltransferase [Ignavibacteria bacterium]|jgi:hypothetical protein|nr:SAM-dependent methyltransferase [Ignavibacteria bacterium]